jgi:hypothetical protein
LPRQRLLSVILRYFEDGHSHPVLRLLDALERDSGADAALREAFERVVNGLIDEDVLRVDLCLPARAANVWEALDAVVPRLLEPERTRWSDAVRRIKLHCEQLGENFEECKPAEVDALRRAIAEDLQGLWQAAGLPDRNPEPAVRLDMRLPFAVAWSTATFEAAQRATKALLAFHAADGGAELFRRQSIYNIVCSLNGRCEARLLAFLADGPVDPGISEPRAEEGDGREGASAATRELLFSRLPPNSAEAQAAAEHCRTWEDILEAVHDRRVYSLPARAAKPRSLVGPWGSLLVRFGASDTVWIGPGRPDSALFVARFVNLFGEPIDNGKAPLLEELREHLAVAADNGIELADVVGWHPLNPNAAIRPLLAPSVLDAHGDRETNLQDLQLRIPPNSARPWLLRPHDSLPLVPVLTCAANLGARDGINSALAKLACAHGWEFLAFGFPPLRAELLRWHHLPRLLLDDGMVLAAERWTLDKSVVSQLGRCSGSTRYLAWRREADRMKLPALVHARASPDALELLMCTESPLAVQCCFDGSNDRASDLSLTELAGDPESWPVTDAEGRHYLSEVAVTWCADYYWGEMAKEVSA